MIRLLNDEREALARYIYSVCAVTLDESKAYLIESRLSGLVAESGCTSYRELLGRAMSDRTGTLRRSIIDAITTGETLFFRDMAPFDLLRHKILPELLDRRARLRSTTPIRIWSAACSSGQELYSIAMLLKDLLGDPDRYGVRLLGTDISDQAVSRASKGIYSAVEIGRGLGDDLRLKYFRPVDGAWQVRDEIRAMASFKRQNLMEDFSALGRFDIIFCRNVAIYFTERDRKSLFGKMERALERDGVLVIGAMESLTGICPQFESRRHLRAVFYQAKAG